MASILFRSLGSINGPFFNDLDISYLYRLAVRLTATTHNILISFLVTACLITQCGFAPRALGARQTNGLTTFTTTMWMIARGHGRATNCGPDALMALATSLAQFDIAVIEISNLTGRGIAGLADQTNFTGRHTYLGKIAFLCQQLCRAAC